MVYDWVFHIIYLYTQCFFWEYSSIFMLEIWMNSIVQNPIHDGGMTKNHMHPYAIYHVLTLAHLLYIIWL